MPVIAMSRPWLRPDDGKFYLRKKTPVRYREVAGRAEFRIPLNTRDPKEAKARISQALATWADMEAQWDRELRKEALSERRANEIAALWAAWVAGGAVLDRAGVDVPEPGEPWHAFSARVRAHAEDALHLAETTATEETLPLLHQAIAPLVMAAYTDARASDRAQQDGIPAAVSLLPTVRAAFPAIPVPVKPTRTETVVVTFDAIWERWSKVTATAPRTVHETKGILKQLEAFLGHDDASRVTKSDLLRWRDALKADGKSNNTWNNRLSLIGQVFKRAVADDVLPADPTVGLRLGKGKQNSWKPYSDEDTVAILQAARKETSPALRWAHWVMALSGMRVGEVLQLTGDDIAQDPKSGVWFMAVKHDPENGKAAKNSLPRHVPMHPSLVDEGFLTYAQGIKEKHSDARLFPDKKPDKYGRLGGRAWNLVGSWVREKVGIRDKDKAPNHSWRHRMEDELRAAEVDESVRDAIIGHARKTVGAKYGVRGEALARLHRELSKVKLPKGL
ncbi:DUF6538 domain-containing protein [Falsiroseomonas sp. HW251]|uniref:DUF6538 domain-containing protein n=1 Tax=Falsiroseomonas sp. HW251 TaxID=3390998 RepID=UPI003D3147BA